MYICGYSAFLFDAVINSQRRADAALASAGMSDDAHKFWLIRFQRLWRLGIVQSPVKHFCQDTVGGLDSS